MLGNVVSMTRNSCVRVKRRKESRFEPRTVAELHLDANDRSGTEEKLVARKTGAATGWPGGGMTPGPGLVPGPGEGDAPPMDDELSLPLEKPAGFIFTQAV